jgi:anti-sigma factor RsiW
MSHLGQRLSALIDGELDGDERDRVLVHLARCEPCRDEAIALRTLKRRMNALGEAAADSALTRRLMGLAQPGEHLDPAASGSSAWSRSAVSPLGSDHGSRELRPAWYVTFGAAAVVVVGVGTAAFLAGGGPGRPAPRVTPAVDTYVMQHDLLTGVVPGAPSVVGYGPRPAVHHSKSFSSPAP